MLNKRLFAMLTASLLLAACGGGDDNELSREYGVVLLVNGTDRIVDRTMQQVELTRDNAGDNYEDCLQTVTNDDAVAVEIPYYDNFEDMGGDDSDYCNGERLGVTSGITFQARFLNNTYDDMPITYRGVGVEIRIYDENDVEVWNSNISQSLSNDYYELDPFDPFTTQSRTLKAGEAFPSQKSYAITYYFLGDGNYADSDSDPATYNLEDDYQALGWNTVEPSESQCELSRLQDGIVVEDLDTATTEDDRTRAYQKPICQTEALPPGRYRVSIEYSFTPAVAPVEFFVTLVAPEA